MKRRAVLAGICAGMIFAALPAEEAKTPEPRQAEAECFFNEAKAIPLRADTRDVILAKLDAAIAIVSDEPRYRAERCFVLFKTLRNGSSLADCLAILEPMLGFELQANPGGLDSRSGFRFFWLLDSGNLRQAWEKAVPEERRRLAALCDRFRPAYHTMVERMQGEPQWGSPFAKFERRVTVISCTNNFCLYYDQERFKAGLLENRLAFLKCSAEFFREHPGPVEKKQSPEAWISPWLSPNWCMEREPYVFPGVKFSAAELAEYQDEAAKHPLPYVRGMGLVIRLFLATRDSNHDPKAFRGNFDRFAEDLSALNLSPAQRKDLMGYLQQADVFEPAELDRYAREVAAQRMPEWVLSEEFIFAEEVLAIRDREKLAQFLLDNSGKCRKYEPALRTAGIPDLLRRLVIERNSPAGRRALELFNHDVKARMILPRESHSFFTDGVVDGRNLYLTERIPEGISVKVIDRETDSVRELYRWKTRLTGCVRTCRDLFSDGYALDCDGELLAVGAEDAIHLFRLDGSEAWTITDLPDPYVNAVALLDGRLYVWCGCRSSSFHSSGPIFFSCDLHGGDRRYHYNGKRQERDKNFPDNLRGMLADRERHRLLLLQHGELFEFRPDTGQYRRLMKKPENASSWGWESTLMQWSGPRLMIAFGGEMMIFDPRTDESEWYFTGYPQFKDRAVHFLDGAPDFAHFGGCQFLANGNYLWMNQFGRPYCIRTGPGEWRRLFHYPAFDDPTRNGTFQIFPAADEKSIYQLCGGFILKFTPNEEAVK